MFDILKSKKSLLLTGGAGFIGSNFIRLLLENNFAGKMTVLDKLTYAGNLANIEDIIDKFDFIRGDIADTALVMKLFDEKRFDVVINFAAESHVDRSLIDSSPFLRSNIVGTAVLLEAARDFGVERFCQISTDEVYGSIDDGSFTEESKIEPSSPYSASKAAADALANAYRVSFGVPVVITRSSNNYGPFQYPEKLIPFFVKLAKNGKNVTLYGDGQNIRDWLYVKDNCRGILTVIEKGDVGEVYNIGAGVEKPNLEIANRIINIVGTGVGIDFVEDRKGHDRRYSLDSSKISKLGWSPQVDFDTEF
jgi:dTDP-glucose 4,6-dehydratase